MNERARFTSRGAGWFALPYMILFILFLIVPIVWGLWMSFTDQSLASTNSGFVAIDNYLEAFTSADMYSSLLNTLFFTLISSVPLVILSFVLAYLVVTGLPGQWLWRLTFFAPHLLPVSVVTAMWGMMFANDFGFINGILVHFGIDQIGWLSEKQVAMWSIALTTVWWTIGFNFLLYLSALQNIPDTVYEAAQVDGADAWRRLRSVTLPMMRPTTVLIVLLQILASLKVFDQIFLMTAGGPDGATRSIIQYIYDQGFSGYRVGYASAVSYIFFAMIVVVSLIQVAITNRNAKER
ncbi:carbohydrate ABC transporter permease [Dermabacter hominis]|uniref:carbohydrate ABC transporter permease n=1 Tax=Dermabacter hominis TaxID=36740 RepID=UPI0021A710B1|nr:sugar ABC transporter permease [Dermabacter hominis]MCT1716475.1 sugar ABC transporter permease [Dermabacter hominis]MCT1789959.1 sugar ABC transporter permease [Dermabacter hominis]